MWYFFKETPKAKNNKSLVIFQEAEETLEENKNESRLLSQEVEETPGEKKNKSHVISQEDQKKNESTFHIVFLFPDYQNWQNSIMCSDGMKWNY